MADFSRENLSTLDRDGISEEIFKLLWAKDELNFGPNLNIPDTVIYKYGQPVAWYFTSLNGRIKRKNKQNLVSAKIEEAFNKYVLGYDVLAYFITMPSEHERSATTSSANDGRGSGAGGNGNDGGSVVPETIIQYFDREGLQNFLYNHKKGVNGILQRFIEPKSTHNEVIRSIWSPKLCLLERAENIHELHDHRYGMYERCVVYEGPDYYFTSAPLRGPVLSGQLQKTCESIVYHISEVTYGQKQVSRIVLNFKVDSRDKVWFLYSTSIRCDDLLNTRPGSHQPGAPLTRHLLNIDRVVSLPEEISLNPQKSYSRLPPPDRVRCLSCNEETLDNLRYPISYKAVIKHYDHVIYILRTSSGTTAEVLGLTGSSSAPPGSAASNSRASTAKGIVVPWPPDKELIKAAGGVGFGCLQREESNSSASLHHLHHVRYRTWRDIQIPPMLAALHPKLSADTYAKCKSDPLFQNKTLQVCEACYLVYADFLTMLLRVGGNLQKLLSPDPAAPMTATSGMRSAAFQRPTSADWRAISTAMSQSRHSVSGFSRTASASTQRADEARDRAIGLRTDDLRLQPEVPSPIRNASDSFAFRSVVLQGADDRGSSASPVTAPAMTTMGSVTTTGSQADDMFNGGLLDLGSQSLQDVVHGYDGEKVQAMIAERERRFFKEISLNPQLKDQHPLMHLITAQQRLQLVDQQSGVLMSKAAAAQESIFPEKYGHQKSDKHAKFGAYGAEIPYAINGEIILPSSLRARRAIQATQTRAKKQAALQQFLQAEENDNQQQTQPAQTAGSVASSSAQSSKQYRDFLANCLQKIESDLGEAVGYPPMKDEMIAEMNEAATTTTAARSSTSPSRRKPSSVSSAQSSRKKAKDSKPGRKERLATTLPAGATPLSPLAALPRLASCPEVISHSKSEDNENPAEELKEEKNEEDKAQSPPLISIETTGSSYEE